jgi:gamma-glutamylcyclotransferase (GGCT)/AIG2-like uncharacterized protein YtfP
VLRAAVSFVGSAEGFDRALERAVVFAGRPNYAPVLVGAIGGARWGAGSIPDPMLSHCTNRAEIEDVATSLVERDATDYLFVYGTLMRGECRHETLGGSDTVLAVEEAEVTGRLVDCGSYPGFVRDPACGRVVRGELVRVRETKELLARLDLVEGYLGEGVPGSLYHRTLVEARSGDGVTVTAWIYELVEPEGFPDVESGCWRSRR